MAKWNVSSLGVEGDTAAQGSWFARYDGYRQKIAELKEVYKHAQEQTMCGQEP
ncbi:hypothetical protein O9929_13915 [Vibrio lentus]|nr:hypothetical protein [Vibrio lentus]